MKILLLSDAHGKENCFEPIKDLAKTCDCVLYAGDFSALNKPETAQPLLNALLKINDNVFAVTGNADEVAFKDVLESHDVSIEASFSAFDGLLFAGSGGASHFTGDTPNERDDEDLVGDLNLVLTASQEEKQETLWDNLVLVMHNPPKDTSCDKISAEVHVGSPLLREFIENHKPLLVVCGHIHEAASIDQIGETVVINPGSIAEGNYAVVELSGGVKKPFTIIKKTLYQK